MSATLADLQAAMQAYVTDGAPAPVSLALDSPTADAETLLGVYRDAYRLRLLEALGEDYRGLKQLVGEDAFDALGRTYIEATPSRHYSIRWYGRGLAAYLADADDWAARSDLAELARWEWTLGEAADAADADALTDSAFAALAPEDWPGLTLAFHPSLRRLDLAWSVPAWRQAVEDETADAPAPARADDAISWTVWRREAQVHYRSLDAAEAAALDAARSGATFGDLCESLAHDLAPDAAAQTAAGFLKAWLDAGWIVSVATRG